MQAVQDLKAIRFMVGTKVSHDYLGDQINTFSYRELIENRSPAIGLPCKENGLIVIDVDVLSDQHKHDGREFWSNFCIEYGMPRTYTVQTASGGYHFYYRLPLAINPETFSPPATLAPGVDVKYRGWVGAPPTEGYTIIDGNLQAIQEAPPSLIAYMESAKSIGHTPVTFDTGNGVTFNAHRDFSDSQIKELKSKITWLQSNGSLDRAEWRDGIFALKAGISDPALLEEMVDMWTMNKNYVEGDEVEAHAIAERADKYGSIGPGTIFAIIKAVIRREGATALNSIYSTEEIINRSRVVYSFAKDGSLKIETSESNAAALLGAMYDIDDLHHDVRSDMFVYKGNAYSDTELVNILIPLLQSPHKGLGLEKFRRSSISSGLEVLLEERKVDPHLEYLKTLVWDGVPRIEKFFQEYCHVEDNAYHRKVSKNFWVALAARGLRPGCKFDTVVILEGAEGIRKSSLVEAIGGEYTFAPARKDAFENTDELRKMHQSIVVELPELMGLVGENSEKVKAFLASPFDYIRALYSKRAMKQKRGFVFIGTTNSDRYLAADMGLRRFWPVKIPSWVKNIEVDGIKRDRDQLFAEAIQYYNDGYSFYDMPQEYLMQNASGKIITDALQDTIADLVTGMAHVKVATLYTTLEASGFISKGLNAGVRNRLESVLKAIGYERSANGDYVKIGAC